MNDQQYFSSQIEGIQMIADAFRSATELEDVERLAAVLVIRSDYNRDDQEIEAYSGEEYLFLLKGWREANAELLYRAASICGGGTSAYEKSKIVA